MQFISQSVEYERTICWLSFALCKVCILHTRSETTKKEIELFYVGMNLSRCACCHWRYQSVCSPILLVCRKQTVLGTRILIRVQFIGIWWNIVSQASTTNEDKKPSSSACASVSMCGTLCLVDRVHFNEPEQRKKCREFSAWRPRYLFCRRWISIWN